MAWRIRNWNERHETASSRRIISLTFFCEPIQDEQLGYGLIMDRQNGPAIYGVWSGLKKIASSTTKDFRGKLIRPSGQPHSIKTLSVSLRMPEALIKEAIEVLCEPDIAWLEEFDPVEVAPPAETKPQPKAEEKPEPEVAQPKKEWFVDEVAERICARHPQKKTMGVQACGRLLKGLVENAADPAASLDHIDRHHAWRLENEWSKWEPRYMKPLSKWLSEDPLAPIPTTAAKDREEEPDYVENF